MEGENDEIIQMRGFLQSLKTINGIEDIFGEDLMSKLDKRSKSTVDKIQEFVKENSDRINDLADFLETILPKVSWFGFCVDEAMYMIDTLSLQSQNTDTRLLNSSISLCKETCDWSILKFIAETTNQILAYFDQPPRVAFLLVNF